MPINFERAQYLALCPRYTNAPTEVTLSTSSARNSSALGVGFYIVRCDVNCYIKQGTSSVTADANDFIISAGSTYPMAVTDGTSDSYLAGILASGSGTLQILQLA